jgi:hypothetical protein
LEGDKVIMLERLGGSTNPLPASAHENGLKSSMSNRVAQPLAGQLDMTILSDDEQRSMRQGELPT